MSLLEASYEQNSLRLPENVMDYWRLSLPGWNGRGVEIPLEGDVGVGIALELVIGDRLSVGLVGIGTEVDV